MTVKTSDCGLQAQLQFPHHPEAKQLDAVVRQDSEMPGPQFHTILKSTTLCSRKDEEKTSHFLLKKVF